MRVHTLVATAIALASFAVAGCASDIDDPMTEHEVQQPSGASRLAGPFGDMDQTARWSAASPAHAKPFVDDDALEAAQFPAKGLAKPFASGLEKTAVDPE